MNDLQIRLADDSILLSGMTFKQEFSIFCLRRNMILDDINREKDDCIKEFKEIWINEWEKNEIGNSFHFLLKFAPTILNALFDQITSEKMEYRLLLYQKCEYFKPYNIDKIPLFKKKLEWDDFYEQNYSNVLLDERVKSDFLRQISSLLNINQELLK